MDEKRTILRAEVIRTFGYAIFHFFHQKLDEKSKKSIYKATKLIENMNIRTIQHELKDNRLSIDVTLERPGLLIGNKGVLIKYMNEYISSSLDVDETNIVVKSSDLSDLMYAFQYEYL